MKQEAMQKHSEEWFFLHNFDVDRVFSTIRRTDYLVLFYIKMRQESHPDEKLYLADLAAEMGVKVTELSKGIEKLQDQGYVRWLTDREAGRTYVELTSKAVELMAEERDFMKRCYARLRPSWGTKSCAAPWTPCSNAGYPEGRAGARRVSSAPKYNAEKGPASGCGSRAFVRLGADQLLLEEDGFTILLAGILFMAEVLRLFSSVLRRR